MTPEMAQCVLFGHGSLSLEGRPDDYGEMRVYSGVSSPDEMSPAREESYRIARALGVDSDTRLVSKVNFRQVGLLPSPEGLRFTEECSRSFAAPEVERDLVKEGDADLLAAIDHHAISGLDSEPSFSLLVRLLACFGSSFWYLT